MDDALLTNIHERIETGGNVKVLQGLGADDDFLSKRQALLNKFLTKISCKKEKPKIRKKPLVRIVTNYQKGSCLSFQYPDRSYGGAIVVTADLFNTKGAIGIALTTIHSNKPSSFRDFECSKIIDFKWSMVSSQAERYAAIEINGSLYTGMVGQRRCEYRNKQERELFFSTLDKEFIIVGKLPEFTQILCTTTWINMELNNITAILDFYYHLQEQENIYVSDKTLYELTEFLSVRYDR